MYLLLADAGHIPPVIPCSNINSIFSSVNNSNFTFVIFKHACHANPRADTKCAGSSLYIFGQVSLKFSKMSASNRVSD